MSKMEGWSYCRLCQEPILMGMYCLECSEIIDFIELFVHLLFLNPEHVFLKDEGVEDV